MDAWFLIRGGKRIGPLSVADLRARAAAGEIAPADLLWKQGLANPVPCSSVRWLFASASQPALPGAGIPASVSGPAAPPPLPGAGGDSHPRLTGNDLAIGLVIPHKVSALAVVAGYVGLLSIVCFPAPIAIILGILALIDLRKRPGRTGYGRAIFAIVMGSIALIVGLVVLVLTVTTQ